MKRTPRLFFRWTDESSNPHEYVVLGETVPAVGEEVALFDQARDLHVTLRVRERQFSYEAPRSLGEAVLGPQTDIILACDKLQ